MRERGHSIAEASVIAAKSRLRPILMTTLTTVLGMVPMAIGTGEGAEMWRSLGMVVAWGLSVSTIVTLVIIPTIYASLTSMQERRALKKAARAAGQMCPKNHLGWAIISLILFWPLGIFAVINSVKVKRLWISGDVEGAQAKADRVKKLCWLSVIIMIALNIASHYLLSTMF
jgi:predicted RND superfamily exporter protein